MEKSEPTLVPEWLKGSNGGITGGGSSHHHFTSSLRSDDHTTFATRNRSSMSSSDHNNPRSSGIADRTSSSHFHRSLSSNGSIKHDKDTASRSYSSFGRSHRGKDREKALEYCDKEKLLLEDDDFNDSLTLLKCRIKKDTLPQSMMPGKQVDIRPKRVGNESVNGHHVEGNSSKIVTDIHKSAFKREFPSLGSEDKQLIKESGKVFSSTLSTVSQSLPVRSSTVIGGDGWTSALAEVPVMVGRNNSMFLPVAQTATASSSTLSSSSTVTGLNMAETLAQTPSRFRSAPRLSVESQKLEELAIKQSRQLIPMMPLTPKNLALSSSDKTKTKGGQQVTSSQLVNNALRGPSRSDILKLSQSSGKLLVLKGREKNGTYPTTTSKEALSQDNASRVSPPVVPPAAALDPPPRSPNDMKPKTPNFSASDRKLSQAQNRNDFFNSLRKKVSTGNNDPSSSSHLTSSMSPSLSDKSVGQETDSTTADPVMNCISIENGIPCLVGNGDFYEESESFALVEEEKILAHEVYPDEEEAAFLKSLGWEENAAGEEALTEEEIKSFYEEYSKLRPCAKLCRGMHQLESIPLESQAGGLGGASSGCSSSMVSGA